MRCTKCESDNTQRLEVVYMNGTSVINTKSRSLGVGMSDGLGLGAIATKTKGTSQTVLSEQAAPPHKKSYKWPGICVFLAAFFMAGSTVLGWLMIAGGGWFIYQAYQHNTNVWPELYKRWQASWLCHKCGCIYQIVEGALAA